MLTNADQSSIVFQSCNKSVPIISCGGQYDSVRMFAARRVRNDHWIERGCNLRPLGFIPLLRQKACFPNTGFVFQCSFNYLIRCCQISCLHIHDQVNRHLLPDLLKPLPFLVALRFLLFFSDVFRSVAKSPIYIHL